MLQELEPPSECFCWNSFPTCLTQAQTSAIVGRSRKARNLGGPQEHRDSPPWSVDMQRYASFASAGEKFIIACGIGRLSCTRESISCRTEEQQLMYPFSVSFHEFRSTANPDRSPIEDLTSEARSAAMSSAAGKSYLDHNHANCEDISLLAHCAKAPVTVARTSTTPRLSKPYGSFLGGYWTQKNAQPRESQADNVTSNCSGAL